MKTSTNNPSTASAAAERRFIIDNDALARKLDEIRRGRRSEPGSEFKPEPDPRRKDHEQS